MGNTIPEIHFGTSSSEFKGLIREHPAIIINGIDQNLVQNLYKGFNDFLTKTLPDVRRNYCFSNGMHYIYDSINGPRDLLNINFPIFTEASASDSMHALNRDFPALVEAIHQASATGYDLSARLGNIKDLTLTLFRYHHSHRKFRVKKHSDSSSLFGFPSDTDPLEFLVEKTWHAPDLKADQMIFLRNKVEHRVHNQKKGFRYASGFHFY